MLSYFLVKRNLLVAGGQSETKKRTARQV